jgi:protease-4
MSMSKLRVLRRLLGRCVRSVPFFVVAALALGWLIGALVVPRPYVATLDLSGVIYKEQGVDLQKTFRGLRSNRNVKAVVLEVDSPGGLAVTTQQVYLDLLKLRRQKPVVALIGAQGASGAYHVAVACNYIYAQPASQVGSIGAWVALPERHEVDEESITTGPFKATGGSRRDAVAKLEMARREFVSAVVQNRQERLELSEEKLSRAGVYTGLEALEYGLIDEIGTRGDAIAKAASLAGIRNYGVVKWYAGSARAGIPSIEALRARAGLTPTYYYLHFESE